MYRYCLLMLSFMMASTLATAQDLKEGIWQATIQLPNAPLRFGLEIRKQKQGYSARVLNADERLPMDDVHLTADSVKIDLELFDMQIALRREDAQTLRGKWLRFGLAAPYELPIELRWGITERYPATSPPLTNLSGKWAITMGEGTAARTVIGVFEQVRNASRITGSILTPTGDYRYLDGTVSGKQMQVSTFDGSHAIYLSANLNEQGELTGEYHSGKASPTRFRAVRNDTINLPNPEKMTYLKEGYDKLAFSFVNLEGKKVSLDDERYKGKVVIVQILGSWCPNCMDETSFLAPWYKRNRKRGVEIIGLAYERSPEYAVARPRVEKLRQRFGVEYELLIAGVNQKEAASASLPMLNGVLAYPTTIYIDKKGKVRKIHTGFSGPGTGKYFEEWKTEFDQLIRGMLAE